MGSLAAIQAGEILRLYDSLSAATVRGLFVYVTKTGAGLILHGGYFLAIYAGTSGGSVSGLFGEGRTSATADDSSAEGLNFAATANAGACRVAAVTAVSVAVQCASQSGVVTAAYGVRLTGNWASGSKPVTAKGIYIETSFAPSGVVNAYGLHIEDMAGSTLVRLLEIGPATPYLRLVGGATPGANQTNLYLAEGVTPTLRRVQWKLKSALVDADMVMVLV